MPARNIIYAVLSGNVELGLGPFQKDMAAFESLPLYSDSRHLVVSPRHPQYQQIIRGDERALRLTPLIASALDSPDMRPSIQRLRDQFSTVWEVSSLRLRIHMVEQGMGVTFIDRKLLQEHPDAGSFESWMMCHLVVFTNRWAFIIAPDGSPASGARHFIALCQRFWNL